MNGRSYEVHHCGVFSTILYTLYAEFSKGKDIYNMIMGTRLSERPDLDEWTA
jgi:hypothetical protein